MNIIPSQCIASSIPLSEQGFESSVKIKLIKLHKTTASDLSLIEITPTNLSRDPLIAKNKFVDICNCWAIPSSENRINSRCLSVVKRAYIAV